MKYAILDWITGNLDRYKTKEEALKSFTEQKEEAIDQKLDFDKMLIEIFEEHNSID